MELPNPNRIDLDDQAAILLWSDMLSVTTEQLVEIVQKVGPMTAAVRFYATKLATERKPAKAPVDRAARDVRQQAIA